MPAWTFTCETRTSEQNEQLQRDLHSFRLDPNIRNVWSQADALNPFTTNVRVEFREVPGTFTYAILTRRHAEPEPVVPAPFIGSLWSNTLHVSDIRPQGAPIPGTPHRSMLDIFQDLARRNIRMTAHIHGEIQLEGPRDDMVDAFALAISSMRPPQGPILADPPFALNTFNTVSNEVTPEPRPTLESLRESMREWAAAVGPIQPMLDVTPRFSSEPTFRQEFLGEFQAGESPADPGRVREPILPIEPNPQARVDLRMRVRERTGIGVFNPRGLTGLTVTKDPEPPKPAEPPGPPRRTRFERINDD